MIVSGLDNMRLIKNLGTYEYPVELVRNILSDKIIFAISYPALRAVDEYTFGLWRHEYMRYEREDVVFAVAGLNVDIGNVMAHLMRLGLLQYYNRHSDIPDFSTLYNLDPRSEVYFCYSTRTFDWYATSMPRYKMDLETFKVTFLNEHGYIPGAAAFVRPNYERMNCLDLQMLQIHYPSFHRYRVRGERGRYGGVNNYNEQTFRESFFVLGRNHAFERHLPAHYKDSYEPTVFGMEIAGGFEEETVYAYFKGLNT